MKYILMTVIFLLNINNLYSGEKHVYIGMFSLSQTPDFASAAVSLGYKANNFFIEGYTISGGAIGLYKEINDFRVNAGVAYINRYTPMIGVDYKGFSIKALRYIKTIYYTEQVYINLPNASPPAVGYYPSIIERKETNNMLMIGYTLRF